MLMLPMRDDLARGLLDLATDFARAASEAAVWVSAVHHATELLGADSAVVLRRSLARDPDYTEFVPVFVPPGVGPVPSFQAVASLTGKGLVAAPPPGTPGAAPFRPLFDAVAEHGNGGLVYAPLGLREVLLLLYRDAPPALDRAGWLLLETVAVQAGAALDRVRAVERVAELSLRDTVTGVGNRRLVEIVLERSFPLALRGEPLAVLTIRPDAAVGRGEQADVGAAERLRPHVRESDVLARVGPGEFVVVLHACDAKGAELFVKRVGTELPGAAVRAVLVQPDSPFESAGELLAMAIAQPWPSTD